MLQPTKYELWLESVFKYWDMEYGANLEYENYNEVVAYEYKRKSSPQYVCGQLRDIVFGVV